MTCFIFNENQYNANTLSGAFLAGKICKVLGPWAGFLLDFQEISLFLSFLGIYDQSCTKFMDMCNELKLNSRLQNTPFLKSQTSPFAQPTSSSAAAISHGPHLTYSPNPSSDTCPQWVWNLMTFCTKLVSCRLPY